MDELIFSFWAKTANDDSWHPLLFHMLDAGNVATVLWQHYLPPPAAAGLLASSA